MKLFLAGFLALACAVAQQAVPSDGEPHHHVVYEDARVRILNVQIELRGSSLLHRHDNDYVWVSLGDSNVSDTVPGKPATHIQTADGGIHYTRGGITHVAKNE